MSYPIPECKITFNPVSRQYGFVFSFASKRPHYHMEVFESLERVLSWVDGHKEMVWEEPSDARRRLPADLQELRAWLSEIEWRALSNRAPPDDRYRSCGWPETLPGLT